MLKIVLLLMFLQNLETVLSFKSLCPTNEDLKPCNCVSDGQNIRVDCIRVTSVDDVRRALLSTKGIKNVHIDFLRARIDKIPSDLFKGLEVKQVSFTHCNLKSLGDDGKSVLEGLEDTIEEFSIIFSFSEENELKFLNVSGLRAIEHLELEGNQITKLGNEWFRDGPTSLTSLILMTNFIEEIGEEAFANLVNLRTLWLSNNRFKVLKRSMFPSPATHLYSVDFSENGISSLPEDIFSNMPALVDVVLTDNAITQLPETTWSPVWRQFKRVYILNNPLECDSHIEWMFKIAQPQILRGKCEAPPARKNQYLKDIINSNSGSDEDDDI